MEITGEFTFDARQEHVWDVLQNPKVLGTIIPTAMNMQKVGENQYTGELFFRVGDVAGPFRGKIELLNLQAPSSYEIEVQGSSAVGQVNITGGMSLEGHEQQTTMIYRGNINFGGRVASVGSRLLEVSIRSIMSQSFKALNTYLVNKYPKA